MVILEFLSFSFDSCQAVAELIKAFEKYPFLKFAFVKVEYLKRYRLNKSHIFWFPRKRI